MPPLTWNVDTGATSVHVTLRGRPDDDSVVALHEVLQRTCAGQASRLTIDLSALPGPDHAVVVGSALPLACATVTRGTCVLLQSSAGTAEKGPGLHAKLGRDLAGAREALMRGPLTSPSFTEHLLPATGASRRCRDVVTEACLTWDVAALTAAATLIATELVSHAIRHVSSLMTLLVLLHHDVLYVAVRSGHMPPPRPRHADASLELLIIHAFASCWGFLPEGEDTVTWAALPARPGPSHPARPPTSS